MELKQTKVYVPIDSKIEQPKLMSEVIGINNNGKLDRYLISMGNVLKKYKVKTWLKEQELYTLTKEELERVINKHLDYLHKSNVIHDYKDGKCDFRAINNQSQDYIKQILP